jgi:hypothetical protein
MVPAKKRFLMSLATAITLIIIAGCGGGGSVNFPPPQGTFTNANLNGPFAFSYTGSDAGGFLAVAGSFVADGAGHITSGTEDINSGAAVSPNAAVSGTYLVRADGRGTITLNSPAGNSTLDFVIVAGGHALVTRFDNRATGSGTIDQQTTSAFSNAVLAGSFAFTLSGIDTGGVPMAVGGVFTSDASGALTSGLDDSNDNGIVVTNDPMTGSIPVAPTGRGTATLNTSHGALTFAYYVVDPNHLKIVGTNTFPALGGEAFRQTGPFSNASVSGPFAFTVAGADLLSLNPFVAGGVLTSDGGGNITSGIEDSNDGGNPINTSVPLTGTYSMAANGRGTLILNTAAGTFSFAIYPSSGGVLVLEVDNTFLTSGSALQQQTTPFTAGSFQGTYGMNFTAAVGGGTELDSIAEFTADGISKLSGIIDINNSGGITFGQSMTGTVFAAPNGRFATSLQTPLGVQNTVVYLVDGNRALFIEVDGGLVAVGDIRHQ